MASNKTMEPSPSRRTARVPSPREETRGPARLIVSQLELLMDTAKRVAGLAGVAMCLVGSFGNRADAQTVAQFKRQSDVIYGRKFGVALTMEVLTPATRNGLGVVW